jgi:hypothetical protein
MTIPGLALADVAPAIGVQRPWRSSSSVERHRIDDELDWVAQPQDKPKIAKHLCRTTSRAPRLIGGKTSKNTKRGPSKGKISS